MRLRKICKSKKVIGIILSILVAFCATFTSQAKTVETMNNPNRIEYKMNKTIGIKNKREMANMNMTTKVVIDGKEYNGRKMQVKATAFSSAKDEGGAYAFNGERLRDGHIAVDFKVIPMNSLVYIPQLGKIYKAVDTGSSIKNNKIDIWMATKQQCYNWGIRNIEIIILDQK